jgi:hypothetical protein
MGEDFLDSLVMEAGDMVKSAVRGCASSGHQDMDVGMEIDAISESLDYRHYSRHKIKACDGTKIFQEGLNSCQR